MEKRKIVYIGGSYQILKPKDNGNGQNWHAYGQQKSMKGISDLLYKNEKYNHFEIEIPQLLIDRIERYRIKQEKKKEQYFAKKNSLESKTI